MRMLLMLVTLICVLSPLGLAAKTTQAMQPVVISFSLVPTTVKIKDGKLKRLELQAVLASAFNLPKAKLIARVEEYHTLPLKYTSELKLFIKSQNLPESAFLPLEAYLKNQVKLAKKNPEPFVQLADNFLKTGQMQSFSLDLE